MKTTHDQEPSDGFLSVNQLFPEVYDTLKAKAQIRVAQEREDHSLQATVLVHEAYLRLRRQRKISWRNRRHFFVAASEAMERILIERARRRAAVRYGGGLKRLDIDSINLATDDGDDTILFVSEVLQKLDEKNKTAAQLVRLRFFAGLSNHRAAEMLGLSERTAKRTWAYAKAWLRKELDRMERSSLAPSA